MVLRGSHRMPWDVLDDAEKMDPYQVLRVPFLSNRERIRKAYVGLCRKEHPDLHGGQESMEWLMGEWAYRVLTDPQDKAAYDTARVLRNALSVTEGIVAFSFAALTNFGSFMADTWNVVDRGMQALQSSSRQIERKDDGASDRPSDQPVSSLAKGEEEVEEEAEDEEKDMRGSERKTRRRSVRRNSSRDEHGKYVPLMRRAQRASDTSVHALADSPEALQIAVAEEKLAEGKAKLQALQAQAESEGSQENGSLMSDITDLRDDIAQLRQDIKRLAKDANRARNRLTTLQEAEATV